MGLHILEERRNRADLIQVFKMKNGEIYLKFGEFFELQNDPRTRGINGKLGKIIADWTSEISFSERVVEN